MQQRLLILAAVLAVVPTLVWARPLMLPIHDVVYEDLVADPERACRDLIGFCGLPWDERCLSFHENPRAVRTPSK